MMFATMRQAELYPPQYSVVTGPDTRVEKLKVVLLNQGRPSVWEQVEAHLKRHPNIGNAEVRALLGTDDPVRASRMLKGWLAQGVLVVEDPDAPKQQRRYTLPGAPGKQDLFSLLSEKGARGGQNMSDYRWLLGWSLSG